MATSELDEAIDGELITQPQHGNTMVQVKGSYATAVFVQKPREINAVAKRLKEESLLAGELFYYGWSAGGERIEGASIGLAMAAARCWGNCATEQEPVQETKDAWIFSATFVDLETGFTTSRQFRQSKSSKVHGKHDEERKADMRFQIGQSKAIRNVILNALPKWLIYHGQDAAMEGVREKIEACIKKDGLPAATAHLVKALAKVGVSEAAIIDKFDVATTAGLDLDNLVILRGDLTALQGGQDRPEALFPLLAKTNGSAPKAKRDDELTGQFADQADKTFKHKEPVEQPPVKMHPLDMLRAKLDVNEPGIEDWLKAQDLDPPDLEQGWAIITEFRGRRATGRQKQLGE